VSPRVPLALLAAAALPLAAADDPERLSERARQDPEIVYFLNPPETHSFWLYHDYTETRPGIDKYLNVVRRGSTASGPAAQVLDTGEELRVETLKGPAITAAGLDIGEPVEPGTELVLVRFDPVPKGGSIRLRISETYTDALRYGLHADTLVFDRTLSRPRNAIVLPDGYYLTASSIPASVSETGDGRIRLDLWNPRPDEIAVLIHAKRRQPTK